MNNISLNNIENYNKEICDNEYIIFLKYISLIHELIDSSVDNIYLTNPNYIKYILKKGINNTVCIFNLLLLYTKNLDIVTYHSEKSILFFIEFISQISDINQNLLKLNVKDACLFVYKKTIFEIDNEFRNTYEESYNTKSKIEILELYIEMYNNIIMKVIDNFDFSKNTLTDFKKIVFTKMYKIVESIVHINDICNSDISLIYKKLKNYNVYIKMINIHYNMSFICNNYLDLINYTIKKSYNTELDNNKIKHYLESDIIEDTLKDYSLCKIYNYITNPK